MATMQDIVDLARVDLNDDDKVRWTDATLLRHANDALLISKSLRGDLFIGSLGTPLVDLALSGTFPLPLVYRRPVADFVIGRASMIENEEGTDSKAGSYLMSFTQAMGRA